MKKILLSAGPLKVLLAITEWVPAGISNSDYYQALRIILRTIFSFSGRTPHGVLSGVLRADGTL
jgi:hypothetical protein